MIFNKFLRNAASESNMAQDYSDAGSGETIFFATPPSSKKWGLKRLEFFGKDGASLNFDDETFLGEATLTNGLKFQILKADQTVIDLLDGETITYNRKFFEVGFGVRPEGMGNDFYSIYLDFEEKFGTICPLGPGDQLQIIVHDKLDQVNKGIYATLSGREYPV